jgi:exonuclease III
MDVLSWNVDGTFPYQGSPDSIDSQIQWLDSLKTPPDVLMLQEVNPNRREYWHEGLRDRLGYAHLTGTLGLAKDLDNSNGHITATTEEWDLSENRFADMAADGDETTADAVDTTYPEKLLVTDISRGDTEIQLWNVRAVPGGDYPEEKMAILELIYEHIEREGAKPRVLAGDLNTPKRELPDGQAITYGYRRSREMQRRAIAAELNVLKGLGHFGMVDVFRALHGYGDIEPVDESHDGRRIDHLFASEELAPQTCWYATEATECSDHAAIRAEFGI